MAKQVKGWFTTPDRPGDRTIEQQITGLGYLLAKGEGKTVLDVGCAEGLISHMLIDHGAAAVHGLELDAERVTVADRLRGDRACTFEIANADTYIPRRRYDIVIMLALLHKLQDPTAACMCFANVARDLVVLRLPPDLAPLIVDARSKSHPHDIDLAMRRTGFKQHLVLRGYLNEWIGYYVREQWTAA